MTKYIYIYTYIYMQHYAIIKLLTWFDIIRWCLIISICYLGFGTAAYSIRCTGIYNIHVEDVSATRSIEVRRAWTAMVLAMHPTSLKPSLEAKQQTEDVVCVSPRVHCSCSRESFICGESCNWDAVGTYLKHITNSPDTVAVLQIVQDASPENFTWVTQDACLTPSGWTCWT